MPPKGSRRRKAPAQTPANDPPAPLTEDAKPNVEALNAALQPEPELPSDPRASTSRPTEEQIDAKPVVEAEAQSNVAAPEEAQALEELPDAPPVEGEPTTTAPADTPSATRPEESVPTPTSVQPSSASSTPAPRGRGGLTRPRAAIRRSAAQREALQKAEDERRAAAAAARAAEEARAQRGRGGFRGGWRGRGRGGYMGESDRAQQQNAQPAGPFSGGQILKGQRHIRRSEPSSGGVGYVPGTARRGERPAGRRSWSHQMMEKGGSAGRASGSRLDSDGDTRMYPQDGGYISSDDEDVKDGIQRMNVEDFGVIDLTQDDGPVDLFAPVRVARVQHKDRTFDINAEGATNDDGAVTVDTNDASVVDAIKKSKGKQRASDDRTATSTKQVFHGVYPDSDEEQPQIKPDPEPTSDNIAAATDNIHPDDPPSSPESKRKAKEKIKASAVLPPPLPANHDLLTRQDADEWSRQQDDLEIIREELGEISTADGEGADSENAGGNKRDAKVYLFQFPPQLPELTLIQVKPDPDAAQNNNGDGDVMQVDPLARTTSADQPIKVEDDAVDDKDNIALQKPTPAGAVGKLRVHKSGKVTMDWGGFGLVVEMGSRVAFLQDILIAELPDSKTGVDGAMGSGGPVGGARGEAVGMGQVKGKFVVTPDWSGLVAKS